MHPSELQANQSYSYKSRPVTYLRKDPFKARDSFIFKGKRGQYRITTNQVINYVWGIYE